MTCLCGYLLCLLFCAFAPPILAPPTPEQEAELQRLESRYTRRIDEMRHHLRRVEKMINENMLLAIDENVPHEQAQALVQERQEKLAALEADLQGITNQINRLQHQWDQAVQRVMDAPSTSAQS